MRYWNNQVIKPNQTKPSKIKINLKEGKDNRFKILASKFPSILLWELWSHTKWPGLHLDWGPSGSLWVLELDIFLKIYFFIGGGGGAETETVLKQIPRWVWSLMQGSNSTPRDQDLRQNQVRCLTDCATQTPLDIVFFLELTVANFPRIKFMRLAMLIQLLSYILIDAMQNKIQNLVKIIFYIPSNSSNEIYESSFLVQTQVLCRSPMLHFSASKIVKDQVLSNKGSLFQNQFISFLRNVFKFILDGFSLNFSKLLKWGHYVECKQNSERKTIELKFSDNANMFVIYYVKTASCKTQRFNSFQIECMYAFRYTKSQERCVPNW